MQDRLSSVLKNCGADYAEVRYEQQDNSRIVYRGKELDDAATGKFTGGIVRACVNGGWATATFDSLNDLEHQVAVAVEGAKAVGRESTELAEVDPVVAENPARLVHDFRGVSLDEKLKLAGSYNEILLKSDDAIETTTVQYFEKFRTVHFANSRGTYFMEERPQVGISLRATARDGSQTQRAQNGFSSATSYDVVTGLEEETQKIADRAVALLKAPSCEGGKYTVILDPSLGGVFAHEAFGHLSEADFLYENPQMRDLMHTGREMGVKQLNIVDDGSMGSLIGTQSMDDEGTPTGKTYLIKDGVLAGHLHSLETAAKMGEEPTGNARALGRSNAPIVRMTNTYIEGGDKSFDELIADVDDGIYACDMFGGQTMMEMFTFSAAYGYRIRNGQVGELIRDVVLTGNVFETLHGIDGFGNDMRMLEKTGGCGKGGQAPLPVTFGSPHLRIRDVVVGGQ
ncbi:MAG: TldD/PmbA family protein [Phycisphaerae bacterium]